MESISIITSLLFFYLKARIDFEENFIKIKNPNVVLGFIPFGSKKFTINISQIASVDNNFKFLLKNFILGLFETIIGLGFIGETFNSFDFSLLPLAIIILVFGVCTIINSFQLHLNINTTSGQTYFISVFIFNKAKLETIEEYINQLIANRLDDTNNRKVSEKQTEELKADNAANTSAIVDAINGLKK